MPLHQTDSLATVRSSLQRNREKQLCEMSVEEQAMATLLIIGIVLAIFATEIAVGILIGGR
jgi:hypothetical protein